ncbi:hypothetical protein Ddye_000969 [Dipteronia dyeriana]|uniref:Uncharacterized protein n=1 Tax=Dipteronia dyeriana TaxID=168575 RepID=A0AAE0CSV4_9ROSI|nr:hypothetical protein Ddye_000969 [Dipteronia dyeriana]
MAPKFQTDSSQLKDLHLVQRVATILQEHCYSQQTQCLRTLHFQGITKAHQV